MNQDDSYASPFMTPAAMSDVRISFTNVTIALAWVDVEKPHGEEDAAAVVATAAWFAEAR
jgi:hypothetical protein